jgi:hypothetical protein
MITKATEVLKFLCPDVQWSMSNDDFDTITWINVDKAPITKKQFEDGFTQYDAWKAEQDTAKATQKAALLERLGITEDEAKLLLG